MDTMHLPAAGGFKYIVQGRCSLIFWPEFRMLRAENSTNIGDWIFQDILCCLGSIQEIVTDNSLPFITSRSVAIILEQLGSLRGHILMSDRP